VPRLVTVPFQSQPSYLHRFSAIFFGVLSFLLCAALISKRSLQMLCVKSWACALLDPPY
jgi:hypothetical protein